MRSYPGFCRSKQLEYNPGLTHRRRAGHPRANRRTSDRPSFCGVRPSCSRVIMSCHIFQSTHPLRGATAALSVREPMITISIHAPLAGCDTFFSDCIESNCHFNPRTPCGVRQKTAAKANKKQNFNPRTPCGVRLTTAAKPRRRTDFNPRTPCGVRLFLAALAQEGFGISIHAPLAGCDSTNRSESLGLKYFNPRTPCGVRLVVLVVPIMSFLISIHAPLAGCDFMAVLGDQKSGTFQSTHPLRGATETQTPRRT